MATYRQIFGVVKKVMQTLEKYNKDKPKTMKNNRSVNMNLDKVDKLTGVAFELYCGELLQKQGYRVETTKASGDYGADLVIYKDRLKIVVQTKRYSKNIGVSAVQEIVSARPMYNANESWVITNQYYTKNAINLAKANNVKLLDRNDLVRLMR